MENQEIIFLTPGETTLAKFFLWVRNRLVKHVNKQWVVELPPGKGTATVRDSDKKVTIDLSLARFGGNATTIVTATAPIVSTFDTVDTYNISYSPAYTFTLDVIESGVFVRYTGVAAATRTEF